jgi:tRNA nucleotidyltransferase (CCA-adding enzyme)
MNVIVAHQNMDLDALASVFAAKKLYPDAVVVRGRMIRPPVVRFLALHKEHFPMLPVEEVSGEIETIVVVDVRDRLRIREFLPLVDAAQTCVVYDHHPRPAEELKADRSVVEPVGACVTLLVEEIVGRGLSINADEATLFLLGLYSDTGRLSYSNTHVRDVEVAAILLRAGGSLRVVNRYLRQEYSEGQTAVMMQMIDSFDEISVGNVEIGFSLASTRKFVAGASQVVEQLMELGGHDAYIGFVETQKGKRVQVIARSRVSYVDVGQILRHFGGGGHRGAASAAFKGVPLDEVRERVVEHLFGWTFDPVRVRDIMTTPVKTIEHDMTLRAAAETLTEWCITGAPVMRLGEVFGMLSRTDIERARRNDKLDLPVSSHMTQQVRWVLEDEPIEDVLDFMTGYDIGRMPVHSFDGDMIGIVSRKDLLRELYFKAPDDFVEAES